MTIYILVPVHNRREHTSRFVKCLLSQTFTQYHLVLIDDGSTDGTEEMVRSQIKSLTVLKGKGDWWWAGSLQKGIEWVRRQHASAEDLILMINDDTEFGPEFLERALHLMGGKSRTLLQAQSYSRQTGRIIDAGVRANWKRMAFEQAQSVDEINCLSTRGLFMRVKDMEEIGNFHYRLLPHYASDYEYTTRAHRLGMKFYSSPSLSLFVDEKTTGDFLLFGRDGFIGFKRLFSKKCAANPLTVGMLILLACPWKYKAVAIMTLLYRWARRMMVIANRARSPKDSTQESSSSV